MFAWAAGCDPGRADRGSLRRPRQGERVAGPGGDHDYVRQALWLLLANVGAIIGAEWIAKLATNSLTQWLVAISVAAALFLATSLAWYETHQRIQHRRGRPDHRRGRRHRASRPGRHRARPHSRTHSRT